MASLSISLSVLVDRNGKEWGLDTSKIADVSTIYILSCLPRHEILADLSQINREQESLKQAIDLEPFSEIVVEAT